MSLSQSRAVLSDEATYALVAWTQQVQNQAESPFRAAQEIARRLGAHYHGGRTEVGFWVPELARKQRTPLEVYLEIFTPLDWIDLQAEQQIVRMRRETVTLMPSGEFLWGVIDGMQAGSRGQVGSFYWLKARDRASGTLITVRDPLAYSVPYGASGPAELYDMARLDAERADRGYFATHFRSLPLQASPDGIPTLAPPANILQLHVGTATAEGTLASLTRLYGSIVAKLRQGKTLSPAEESYIGYDAVQLMPIEPIIEPETGESLWKPLVSHVAAENVMVQLRRPSMTNWGYDVLILASSAINPTVLGSKRPDELIDFIAALHEFPGKPIQVIFDLVYGHADNQALPLLNGEFFAGANMHGQILNYRHPLVRAILLEMQRRKVNFGADGVRVDGAQDFKNWDATTQSYYYDNDYLRQMSAVVQEVAGCKYRPWMIFADGRPWPQDDWELTSTYREVTAQQPNAFQWGPLTFAHNTPFLHTFWISKWWRVEEIAQWGSRWITGSANHDTLRRGTQVDPTLRINRRLGDTLPEILRHAYANPAANLLTYTCLPGVPMDFINASMAAPWSFIRNTAESHAVKLMAEEVRFLHWAVDEESFAGPGAFRQLKALGFTSLCALRRFATRLAHAVDLTGYDLEQMAALLRSLEPGLAAEEISASRLQEIALAWMADLYSYCNVAHAGQRLDPRRTGFHLAVREFRRRRPWLLQDLGPNEQFGRQRPTDGSVIFYGLRRHPDNQEQLLFVANMEGAPRRMKLLTLPIPLLPLDGWQPVLVTPGLQVERFDYPFTLQDSQGVLFLRSDR